MKAWHTALAFGLILTCYASYASLLQKTAPPLIGPLSLTTDYTLQHMYYINRAARTDRRKIMERSLQNSGAIYSRVPAVEAENIDVENIFAFRNQTQSLHFQKVNLKTKRFIIAVYESHVGVLAHIAQQNVSEMNIYVILEDDVLLAPHWKSALKKSLALLPSDWSLLRCNVRYPNKQMQIAPGVFRANRTLRHFHGTHFLVTTPLRAARVLRELSMAPLDDIDIMCNTEAFGSYVTSDGHGLQVIVPFATRLTSFMAGHSDHG